MRSCAAQPTFSPIIQHSLRASHPNSCLSSGMTDLSKHPPHSATASRGDLFPAASALEQDSGRARSCFPVGSPLNQVQWLISAGQLDLVPFMARFSSSQMGFIKASREVWSHFHSADPRTGFTTPSSCRALMLQP